MEKISLSLPLAAVHSGSSSRLKRSRQTQSRRTLLRNLATSKFGRVNIADSSFTRAGTSNYCCQPVNECIERRLIHNLLSRHNTELNFVCLHPDTESQNSVEGKVVYTIVSLFSNELTLCIRRLGQCGNGRTSRKGLLRVLRAHEGAPFNGGCRYAQAMAAV